MFKKRKSDFKPTPPAKEDLSKYTPEWTGKWREVSRSTLGARFERVDNPQARRVDLDIIGLDLLSRLEAKPSMERLIEEFADEHRLSYLESRALLMPYMRTLLQRELIRFR
ncbi:MAG: hypothetical protein JJU29_12455 [Verrucomicrobia bacterium]|nr:hypothetical protein [Verrucomicrobiota bacterium]MCH8512908.1 hypothetical protein [Kiritimatiellia bacterium]